MTLTATQAKAIYTAMQALNNVGMRMHCQDQAVITVQKYADGVIHVSNQNWSVVETYPSQQAFANAYGLA